MRSKNVMKNIKVGFIFYIINIILAFISRSIFVKYLGSTITGYNNLIQDMIGFLNISELGIATAISYSLYKPLAEKDDKKVNEIMVLFKYFYKMIGISVLGLGFIASFFLSFFVKGQLPMGKALIYFYIFLLNSGLSYFMVYKQTLIIADQKQYKVTYLKGIVSTITSIIQIAVIMFTQNYFIWALIAFISNMVFLFITNIKVEKEYIYIPFKSEKTIKDIKSENKKVLRDIKYSFFHKIGAVIVFQTDSILISLFFTLKQTAIYSNYMIIINYLLGILGQITSSFTASVGNLISEDNDKISYNIWQQLFCLDHLIAVTVVFSVNVTINFFITIWVGKEYLFENYIITAILINLYITLIRQSVNNFKMGYGIFWDIWSPMLEGGVNLIFSVILAKYYGIIGIFLGTIISNIVIVLIWQPYCLFKYGFKKNVFNYYKTLIALSSLGIIAMFCSQKILQSFIILKITQYNFLNFIILGASSFILISVLYGIMLIPFKSYRTLLIKIKVNVFKKQ